MMPTNRFRALARAFSAGALIAAVLLVAGPPERSYGAERSPHSSDSVRPTAAFLDLSHTVLGGLVERRMLQNPDADWLERAEIETVLRERELQSLMSPEACGERAAIGRLLKADMLILLRHVEEPKAQVQLVVCETKQGLRLAIHALAASGDVEADAERLSALVKNSIREHPREIREICAVPSFVSDDLAYDHDHLKAAYARLVEQTLRSRPGVLTAEVEEAHAIAREVRLTGDEIQRKMPLYFLGSFRHAGERDRLTVTIRLTVKRGETDLADRRVENVSSADGAVFLQRAAQELIGQTLGTGPAAPDAQAEAKQLALLAEAAFAVGGWEDAAALAEASLLLDSHSMRMVHVAALALGNLAGRDSYHHLAPDTVAQGLRYYLRALEHYETLVGNAPTARLPSSGVIFRAVDWEASFAAANCPDHFRRLAVEVQPHELEILQRIIRRRLEIEALDARVFLAKALDGRSAEAQAEILFRTVRTLPQTPVSERLAREFLLLGRTMAILDNPAARGCLKCLATEDHPQVRRAAEQLLAELDHPAPRTPNPGIPRLPPVPFEADPKRVRFEPVEIIYERDKPRQRGAPAAMAGCVPAGPGVDLIWESWQYLYVMKEPGRLKRIWDAGYKNSRGTAITGVRFDGRWAWITTESGGGQPRLLILDPQQERIWEVGERNGLPLASYESLPDRFPRPRLWAEPIEPGRALLVSYFGRMALATVTFSPASGAKVDVFFEARQQPDPTVLQAWFNPRLAFAPAYVFAFAHQSEQGPAERRVVIGGRSQPDDHPLVVDPGTREVRVQVFGLEQGIDASWHAVTQSAVYQLVCSGDLTRHLARVGLPKFRLEYLLSGVPAGRCVAYEGRILIAGQQWWQLDPQADPDHRIRLLTTSLPWTEPFIVSPRQATNQPGGSLSEAERYRLEMLCQSNHFGLLAVRRAEKPPNPCEFFRVVFQGPQTPSPPLATSR